VVIHQLQVERWTKKVGRSYGHVGQCTDGGVLLLCHAANLILVLSCIIFVTERIVNRKKQTKEKEKSILLSKLFMIVMFMLRVFHYVLLILSSAMFVYIYRLHLIAVQCSHVCMRQTTPFNCFCLTSNLTHTKTVMICK